MPSSLSNLKCLVTGASSGIGKATCLVLSNEGATVIGVGRNESSLKELASSGGIADYIVADLVETGASERVIQQAVSKLNGELTTLVNNAGVLKGGAVGEADLSNYEFNMKLNTQVPFGTYILVVEQRTNESMIFAVCQILEIQPTHALFFDAMFLFVNLDAYLDCCVRVAISRRSLSREASQRGFRRQC